MGRFSSEREERGYLTDEDVDKIISYQTDIQTKALTSILYMYGCRISEALLLKRSSFHIDNEFLWVTMPTLKKKPKAKTKPVIDELRKLNVSLESKYCDYIIDYIADKKYDDILFDFSRQIAYYRICMPFGHKTLEQKKESFDKLNIWLHYFRDSCLAQLALNGASALEIKYWAGWSSLSPVDSYIRLSGEMTKHLGHIRVKRGWGK
jgi:integrase